MHACKAQRAAWYRDWYERRGREQERKRYRPPEPLPGRTRSRIQSGQPRPDAPCTSPNCGAIIDNYGLCVGCLADFRDSGAVQALLDLSSVWAGQSAGSCLTPQHRPKPHPNEIKRRRCLRHNGGELLLG